MLPDFAKKKAGFHCQSFSASFFQFLSKKHADFYTICRIHDRDECSCSHMHKFVNFIIRKKWVFTIREILSQLLTATTKNKSASSGIVKVLSKMAIIPLHCHTRTMSCFLGLGMSFKMSLETFSIASATLGGRSVTRIKNKI